MGAALIVPILALVAGAAIWFIYASVKARQGRAAEETLPDDPYERRREEVRRLRAEHAAASPERTTHPARRP